MNRAVISINPATGAELPSVVCETSPSEVSAIVREALEALPALEASGRAGRADLLRSIAEALRASAREIVDEGIVETGLTEQRLQGELQRTAYQAEFFAEVILEGSYLEATIDHAGITPMGPRPDLRRMLVPIGPVAVFGASNFPLAFSVIGGDTVSALAAGCSVIVKAHGSHPRLSQLVQRIVSRCVRDAGLPAGAVGIVYGTQAGAQLVAEANISAVSFTGSAMGGAALLAIINARPNPIPFYGELSGINPVVVTSAAASDRGKQIADLLHGSITGSGGQLCTKPGVVLVPTGGDGDALVDRLRASVTNTSVAVLLNRRILEGYNEASARLMDDARATSRAEGESMGDGFSARAKVVEYAAADLAAEDLVEVFGPMAVVLRYAPAELVATIAQLPPSLTGTLFSEPRETDELRKVVDALQERSGRVLFDQVPTGVAVSWAQNHGGPWPSTNSIHTSVGATASRRFLRPVAWQNAPVQFLPTELRDEATGIPRRIDGHLVI